MKRLALVLTFVVFQVGCFFPPIAGQQNATGSGWMPMRDDWQTRDVTAAEPVLVETPNEHERKTMQPRVRQLLDDGDFDELERTAATLLADTRQLPEGWSRLDTFYVAFKDQPADTPDSVRRSRIDRTNEWIAAKPESTVARLVLAEQWIGYAWVARGGGYANTVSEDGFKLFRERMASAHRALDAARACPERSPRWWVTASRIDLGEHWTRDVSRATFDEGVAAYPSYFSYYFVRAWYLQPRWYGRDGEWERFAAESADRIGGDDGDLLYARIAWDCEKLAYDNVIQESRIDWPRVKRGCEVLLKQYPGDLTALSIYCQLSALAGDATQTRALLAQIADRVDTWAWSKERFKSCRAWSSSH